VSLSSESRIRGPVVFLHVLSKAYVCISSGGTTKPQTVFSGDVGDYAALVDPGRAERERVDDYMFAA
jgi:hypothetical protein